MKEDSVIWYIMGCLVGFLGGGGGGGGGINTEGGGGEPKPNKHHHNPDIYCVGISSFFQLVLLLLRLDCDEDIRVLLECNN